MKKTMFVLFGAALLMATPSCKKGANDPGLSLKSRKSRLAGEYTISNIDRISANTNSGTTTTSTYVYAGNGTATTTSGSTTTSTPLTLAEMTFKKDGTWEKKWNYESSYSYSTGFTDEEFVTKHVTVATGTWAFVGKTKGDFKNKERVQLSTLTNNDDWTSTNTSTNSITDEVTTTTDSGKDMDTYTALEAVQIYLIDMLKGKEMTFNLDGTSSYTNVDADGTSSTTEYVTTETMTLIQK